MHQLCTKCSLCKLLWHIRHSTFTWNLPECRLGFIQIQQNENRQFLTHFWPFFDKLQTYQNVVWGSTQARQNINSLGWEIASFFSPFASSGAPTWGQNSLSRSIFVEQNEVTLDKIEESWGSFSCKRESNMKRTVQLRFSFEFLSVIFARFGHLNIIL